MKTLARRLLLLGGLLLLVSCGKPWRVVAQAVPNPMIGKKAFTVMPIDFKGLLVGSKSEADYVASMEDAEKRESWLGDKKGMNQEFTRSLIDNASEDGIRVQMAGNPSPFVIQPKIEFVEGGFFTYIVNKNSEVRMVVRITTEDGTMVDEIVMTHSTGSGLTNPSSGGRLRSDAKALGNWRAEYLVARTAPPES